MTGRVTGGLRHAVVGPAITISTATRSPFGELSGREDGPSSGASRGRRCVRRRADRTLGRLGARYLWRLARGLPLHLVGP